jgi:cytochrome bd-type quinol oxidase subunit 1
MKKKIVLYAILAIILGSVPMLVSGANSIGQVNITANKIPTIIMNVARWMYTVVLALAVLFILIAAFQYLKADPKSIAKAHKQLMYAVIAIIIAILAFSATKIVENFLNGK